MPKRALKHHEGFRRTHFSLARTLLIAAGDVSRLGETCEEGTANNVPHGSRYLVPTYPGILTEWRPHQDPCWYNEEIHDRVLKAEAKKGHNWQPHRKNSSTRGS